MLHQDVSRTRSYCFACGAELVRDPLQLAPLCSRCTTRMSRSPRSYHILREGSSAEGPLSPERVMEMLELGHLDALDRVAESSGQAPGERLSFRTLGQHPEFAPCFTPTDPRAARLELALHARRRQVQQRRLGRAMRVVRPAAAALVLLGVGWLGWQRYGETLGRPMLEGAARTGEQTVQGALRTVHKALDPDVARRERAQNAALPGEDMLAAIHRRWPDPQGEVSTRVEQATRHILRGSEAALDDARRELEVAVALDDRNVPALANLALVYSRLAAVDPTLGAWSLTAFERAVSLEPTHAAVLRTQAELALGGGFWGDAEARARLCLREQPEEGRCLLVLGEALTRQGQLDEGLEALRQARDLLPSAPAVQLATGRAALSALAFDVAEPALLAFVGEQPEDARGILLLARLDHLVGRREQAARRAVAAAALAPTDPEVALFAGRLLLQGVGKPEAAWDVLTAAGTAAGADPRVARELALYAALAGGGSGRPAEARARLAALLELQPGWAPAVLAEANLLWRSGDVAGAEAALRKAELKGLTPEELGRFRIAQATLHARQNRVPAALEALESARLRAGHWLPVHLAVVETRLRAGSWAAALEEVVGLWKVPPMDPFRDPTHTLPVRLPDPRELARLLYADGEADQRVAERLALGLSVLEAHACLAAGEDCTRAREMLEAVLGADPTQIPALVMLGQVALAQGRAEEAAQHLNLVRANRVEDTVVLAASALALAQVKRGVEAEDLIQRARGGAEAGPWVDSARVRVLWLGGDTQAALSLAREHLEHDPSDLGLPRWLAAQQKVSGVF